MTWEPGLPQCRALGPWFLLPVRRCSYSLFLCSVRQPAWLQVWFLLPAPPRSLWPAQGSAWPRYLVPSWGSAWPRSLLPSWRSAPSWSLLPAQGSAWTRFLWPACVSARHGPPLPTYGLLDPVPDHLACLGVCPTPVLKSTQSPFQFVPPARRSPGPGSWHQP